MKLAFTLTFILLLLPLLYAEKSISPSPDEVDWVRDLAHADTPVIVDLEKGEYDLPPIKFTGDLTIRGKSPVHTRLRLQPAITEEYLIDVTGRLRLENMTVEGEAGVHVSGRTELVNVVLKTPARTSEGGRALHLEGELADVRKCIFPLAPSLRPAFGIPQAGEAVFLDAKKVVIEETTIGLQEKTGGLRIAAPGEVFATRLRIIAPMDDDPALTLCLVEAASGRLHGIDLEGGATALRIRPPNDHNQLEIAYLKARGFGGAGLFIEGEPFENKLDLKIRETELTGASTTAAFGAVLRGGSLLRPELENVTIRNAVTALEIGVGVEEPLLRNTRLVLGPEQSSLTRFEFGLVVNATNGLDLRGLYAEGFDVGVLVSPPASGKINLGDERSAAGVELRRNAVGLQVSSPDAEVRLWSPWSLLSRNGTAILMEKGSLLVQNADLRDNSTGILVRGGLIDLGGGELGSEGENILWPQVGSTAVRNEGENDVYALNNEWGEAASRLAGGFGPISTFGEAGTVIFD